MMYRCDKHSLWTAERTLQSPTSDSAAPVMAQVQLSGKLAAISQVISAIVYE
jgi:hypothetical protein